MDRSFQILEKRWPYPLQLLSIYLWAAATVAVGIFYFQVVMSYVQKNLPWLPA